MYVLGFGLLYDCVENNTVKLYASRAIFGSVVWRFSAVVVMGKVAFAAFGNRASDHEQHLRLIQVTMD